MTSPNVNTKPAGRADDTGDGLLMFLVFTAAVLISTAAVVLIALVDEWWVLGFGFAIHVIMTAVVMLTIVHVMASRRRSIARRDIRPSTSASARTSPAASQQAGAHPTTTLTPEPFASVLDIGADAVAAQGDRESHQVPSARDGQEGLARAWGAAVEVRLTPRGRATPDAQRSELGGDRSQMARRVLVVTDENLASANEVPGAILAQIEQAAAQTEHAAEVYVVAPTLTTRLQSLTGDIDGARTSAGERLRTVFEHMGASGLEFHGTVGDEDQVTALADALDRFPADLILLRLHAPGSRSENWREHRLVDWVRTHTTVPTMAFYFDDEGQFIGREEAMAPVPTAA
jgi:hypothetical protein